MAWYQLESKDSSQLDELAEKYQLHPVHVEDARDPVGRIKVSTQLLNYLKSDDTASIWFLAP